MIKKGEIVYMVDQISAEHKKTLWAEIRELADTCQSELEYRESLWKVCTRAVAADFGDWLYDHLRSKPEGEQSIKMKDAIALYRELMYKPDPEICPPLRVIEGGRK